MKKSEMDSPKSKIHSKTTVDRNNCHNKVVNFGKIFNYRYNKNIDLNECPSDACRRLCKKLTALDNNADEHVTTYKKYLSKMKSEKEQHEYEQQCKDREFTQWQNNITEIISWLVTLYKYFQKDMSLENYKMSKDISSLCVDRCRKLNQHMEEMVH